MEPFIAKIQAYMKEGVVSYKGKPIKIARLDSILDKHVLTALELDIETPRTIFYFNRYYVFPGSFDAHQFLHFVNRILYPVVVLKTIEDVEKFASVNEEWVENTPFY